MKSFYLLLLVVVVGCQSRLVPVSYDPTQKDPQVAVGSQDNVTVYFENLEYESNVMIFDLEIVNESDEGFFFDPEKVYFYTSSDRFKAVENLQENWQEDFKPKASPNYARSKRAVENYYRKSIRSKETGKFLVGLLAVGATALNVASGSGEFGGGSAFANVTREVLVGASIIGSQVADEVLTQKQAQDDQDLYYLDQEMLKSGNVPPDSSIRGKVFFKRPDSNHFYRFVIPLTYYDFIFDMREASQKELQHLR